MPGMKKIKVTRELNENTYLHAIAINQIEQAKKEQDGQRFRWIVPAMAFSVFRVEAICNVFGSQLFSHWSHFESTSFVGKVAMISESLGLTVDFSVEPWQTINKMKDFRNTLAHAKPQKVTKIYEVTENHPEHLLIPDGKKTILSFSNIETASRFEQVATDLEMIWLNNARAMNKVVEVHGSVVRERIEDQS